MMAAEMECQFSTDGQWEAALAASPYNIKDITGERGPQILLRQYGDWTVVTPMELAEIFPELAERQEPLGAEFEAAIGDPSTLYEIDGLAGQWTEGLAIDRAGRWSCSKPAISQPPKKETK